MKYLVVLLLVFVLTVKTTDTIDDVNGWYTDPNHPQGYRRIKVWGGWKLDVTGKDDQDS